MNSVKERLPFLLEGYLAAFALANIGGIATTNIITLVLFLLCFQFFKYAAGRERECALSEDGKKLVHGRSAGKRRTAALVLGIFYTFCYVAAAHGELTGTLENGLFRLIYLGLTAAGLFLLRREPSQSPAVTAPPKGRAFGKRGQARRARNKTSPFGRGGREQRERTERV